MQETAICQTPPLPRGRPALNFDGGTANGRWASERIIEKSLPVINLEQESGGLSFY